MDPVGILTGNKGNVHVNSLGLRVHHVALTIIEEVVVRQSVDHKLSVVLGNILNGFYYLRLERRDHYSIGNVVLNNQVVNHAGCFVRVVLWLDKWIAWSLELDVQHHLWRLHAEVEQIHEGGHALTFTDVNPLTLEFLLGPFEHSVVWKSIMG